MGTVEVARQAAHRAAPAGRRAHGRAAARAGTPRPARAPGPVAAGGDAAGLGRVRRPGAARPVVVDVRRHVRAVDRRDAARRRRGPRRGPAAGRSRRGTARLPALPRGHATPGPHGRHRAAGRARARAPRSAAWPAVLAAGRLWERRGGGSRLRRPARGHRPPAPGDDADRAADGPGGRTRAGHRARPAPFPAGPRGRSRPAGRAVDAGNRRDLARDRSRAPGPSPPARWPAPSWRSTCCGTAPPTRSWPSWPRRTWRRSGSG